MVRKARINELDQIMNIYAYAQKFMASHDNPTQWGTSHPSREMIEADIHNGECNVVYDICETEMSSVIYGVFFFRAANDPTYDYIEGQWLNDESYGVIHRIASDGSHKGVLEEAINYGRQFTNNIRIDTHENNYVMQNALEKKGFAKCGIIYLEDGDPRVAYHKCYRDE